MKVTIGKVNISYDIEKLIEDIKEYRWEEPWGNNYVDESHMTATQEKFNKLQHTFIKKLTDCNNSDKLYDLIKDNIDITAKGVLAKRRKNIIINSNIVLGYSDEHGSHQVDYLCLRCEVISDTEGELIIDEVRKQESF